MLAILLIGGLNVHVAGQVLQAVPDDLEGVGIDEKLDTQIPLDLQFRDSSGASLVLSDLFVGERPVLLSLNYSDCPMLCRVQLNGLVEALKEMPWLPGKEFEIVSVSIDPQETIEKSQQTKQRYLKTYGRPEAAGGWHFLTGEQEAITRLADAVGFRYKYIPDRKEFSHAAALLVCTPDGRVSRYLYGIVYEPQTLKLSLVEAGQGKIGSKLDQLLLYCFHYDPQAKAYSLTAIRIMQLGGLLTLVVLLGVLLPVWLRRRTPAPPQSSPAPHA